MHVILSFVKQACLHPADDECSPDYYIIVLHGQLIAIGSGGIKPYETTNRVGGSFPGMGAQELSVSSP